MKLLLSGEGKTDIGRTDQAGPMAWIVDKLLEREKRIGYSLLECHTNGGECVQFVDKSKLVKHDELGPVLLRGIKRGKDMVFYTRNAQILGLLAKEVARQENGPVIAVLFRDGDGNHSSTVAEWREKFDSIARGFKLVEFETGVPMMPRPKSEAWLLCALKNMPDCSDLENAPGNDDSPHSLKSQLAELIGHEPSAEEQAEWVKSGRINPDDIHMDSFNEFRKELGKAVKKCLEDGRK